MKKSAEKNCCQIKNENIGKKGLQGIIYGLLPHSFCIAFVVFSVIGATTATTIFKKFLLIPIFFEILIGLSFFFATLSAIFYLRRKKQLSVAGVKGNLNYLGILYGTTIAINLLFFFVIFPAVANIKPANKLASVEVGEIKKTSEITLKVQIPCTGHAPLIVDELNKIPGIKTVRFQSPNMFIVSYDSSIVSPQQISSAEIFKSFPLTLN